MEDREQTGSVVSKIYSQEDARMLMMIKLLHSAVWLFMVACIVGIPWAAVEGRFGVAAMLIGVILVECTVLAVNGGKCPLTSIAAQYTEDRADNFDIYLPLLLARHNKAIFGTSFVCGIGFAILRWFAAQ